MIENSLEEKLENNSVAGIIFALKNMGWKDKQEVEHSGDMHVNWNEVKNYGTNDKADHSTGLP